MKDQRENDTLAFRMAELILAELCETITEEQKEELARWRSESAQNEQLYHRVRDGRRLLSFLHDGGTGRYVRRREAFEQYMRRRKRHTSVRRFSVAAAIVVLAVSLISLPRLLSPKEDVADVSMIVVPGRARAVLTMHDGSTVELGTGREPSTRLAENIVVEGDTLSYLPQATDDVPEPQTIRIPRGGEYFLRLSDGTGVWLNSETTLRYTTVFGPGERRVYLEGEAYFEVAHDRERPFVVESAGHLVTVTGTSFAVRAYRDDDSVLTTLAEGSVKVRSGDRETELTPGTQSRAANGTIEVRQVDPSLYTAWHSGKFIFRDQPLKEILSTMARWYDIDIVYTREAMQDIRFTGELKRYENIDELLAKFETLEKVRFTIEDRTVTVSPY